MFDIPGMTELYGPGTGLDCPRHEGIHYWADYYILEILDPNTLDPVAADEMGEMVVTTLCKEAAPLIRYRTRDLTRAISRPCSCGNLLPLHDRILGRSDDMIIFRGVNIYPSQIDQVLSKIPEANCEFQVVIDRREDGKDHMIIRLECCQGLDSACRPELARRVAERIRNVIMVRPEVEILDYCTLPRSERKSKRIFDNRPL
jgi:phenylacetate-CoA ligase